jgi:hypothetical protein
MDSLNPIAPMDGHCAARRLTALPPRASAGRQGSRR